MVVVVCPMYYTLRVWDRQVGATGFLDSTLGTKILILCRTLLFDHRSSQSSL